MAFENLKRTLTTMTTDGGCRAIEKMKDFKLDDFDKMLVPTIYRWPPKGRKHNPKQSRESVSDSRENDDVGGGCFSDRQSPNDFSKSPSDQDERELSSQSGGKESNAGDEFESDDWFANLVADPQKFLNVEGDKLPFSELNPYSCKRSSGGEDYHFWQNNYDKLCIFPIGRGTYSKVYLCVKKQPRCKVAIRAVDRDDAPYIYIKEGFHKEIEIMKYLDHPNIIKFVDWFEAKSKKCLVMELGHRGSLERFIIETLAGVTEETAVVFFRQLVDALAYCHDHGIGHGDVTTHNVLLDKHFRIKLSDFKFATPITCSDFTCAKYQGTYGFVAPEIVDRKPYDPRLADIWSLGCVLFRMVTTKFAYSCQGDYNIQDLRLLMNKPPQWPKPLRNYSKRLRGLVKRMLTVKPSQRITIVEIASNSWVKILTNLTDTDDEDDESESGS